MPEDEKPAVKPVKRAKKVVEDVAPAAEPAKLPTPHEVREAREAQLVEWSMALGLESEGKVDELRARLLERIEEAAETKEEKEAPAEEPVERVEEAPATPKRAKKAEKPAVKAKEAKGKEEAEPAHEARQKPILDPRTRILLRLRAETSARRPPFRRQEWFRYKKFGDEWRKPQGGQSKLRRHFGYRWNLPSAGYRGPREVRGLHPSGFQEVLVHSPRQLEGIDPAKQAVRIAGGVGTRKRELIEKACEERKIRVLNRMVTE